MNPESGRCHPPFALKIFVYNNLGFINFIYTNRYTNKSVLLALYPTLTK